MPERPPDDLTPPGPPSEAPPEAPPQPPPGAGTANPYFGHPQPLAPASSTDKGLGWTGFGLSLAWCVPLLPLAGAVVSTIALARKRFRPRWVAVLALLAGLTGAALQVGVLASPDFWDGIQDGMNESLADEAEEARRSGQPTKIVPFKLKLGDCFDDPALAQLDPDETRMTETVTLLPCRSLHDLEVYAVFPIRGKDYPGTAAIDRVARSCFPAFKDFVGKTYDDSVLEIFYLFPTRASWRLLGDDKVTCVLGHPKRQTRGTLKGTRR